MNESNEMSVGRLTNIFVEAIKNAINLTANVDDNSFIKYRQLAERGEWGEWLLDHARSRWNSYDNRGDETILFELDAESLSNLVPLKYEKGWYSIISPPASIFDIIKELNKAHANVVIECTINITGEYTTMNDIATPTINLQFDPDITFYGERIIKTLIGQLMSIDAMIRNVDKYERDAIFAFMARHILGAMMYLGDAASIVALKGIDQKAYEDELKNIRDTIQTPGKFKRDYPPRTVSIEINTVKVYYIDNPDKEFRDSGTLDVLTVSGLDTNTICAKRVDCATMAELMTTGIRTEIGKRFAQNDYEGLGFKDSLYITADEAHERYKKKTKSQRALDKLTADVDMTPLSPEAAKRATELAKEALASTMIYDKESQMKEAFARACVEGTREAFERELLPFVSGLRQETSVKADITGCPERLEDALSEPISVEKEFFSNLPEMAFCEDGGYVKHTEELGDYSLYSRSYGDQSFCIMEKNPNFVIVARTKGPGTKETLISFSIDDCNDVKQSILVVDSKGFDIRGLTHMPGTWTRAYALVQSTLINELIKDNGSEGYTVPLSYVKKIASFSETIINAAACMCGIP